MGRPARLVARAGAGRRADRRRRPRAPARDRSPGRGLRDRHEGTPAPARARSRSVDGGRPGPRSGSSARARRSRWSPRRREREDVTVGFLDRHDAGRRLAAALSGLDPADAVILALPRGGVPVAREIARALGAPLDILAVRKLGAPGNPEFGVGAIAEGDVVVVYEEVARRVGLVGAALEEAIRRERAELDRRVASYRGGRPPVPLAGSTAVLVDDGVATGLTEIAAVRAARERGAARVIVAVPVGARDSIRLLRGEADEVVCLLEARRLIGVGRWYDDFSAVSDEEVLALLAK